MCRKEKPFRAKKLACESDGFNNLPNRKMGVDSGGTKRPFCPGKATWYPELQRVFDQCLIAKETGLLPKPGGVDDQEELFTEVFGAFVQAYNWRWYGRIWRDVGDVIPKVLEAVAKMFGGKKK